jgi:hypothetical protein
MKVTRLFTESKGCLGPEDLAYMKKNQTKNFYYVTTVVVSLLGLMFASSLYTHEVVVRGLLGIGVLLLTFFFVTHTKLGGSFDEPLRFLHYSRSTLLLFVFAVIVSWAIEDVLNLFFYIVGWR